MFAALLIVPMRASAQDADDAQGIAAPTGIKILPPPANWQAAFNMAESRRRLLEVQLERLDARMLAAERLIDRLDATNLDRAQRDHASVVLRPGEQGYSTIDAGVGQITIAISIIKAIDGGTRLTLQLGNPTTANLSAIRARVQYGEGEPPVGDPGEDIRPRASLPRPDFRHLQAVVRYRPEGAAARARRLDQGR